MALKIEIYHGKDPAELKTNLEAGTSGIADANIVNVSIEKNENETSSEAPHRYTALVAYKG